MTFWVNSTFWHINRKEIAKCPKNQNKNVKLSKPLAQALHLRVEGYFHDTVNSLYKKYSI